MGLLRHRMAPVDLPVFYDPTGKRLRHVLECCCALFFVIASVAWWITPKALAPLWGEQFNQGADFPRKLLSQIDPRTIPVINEDERGLLDRIDRIGRENGVIGLADPFSHKIFRPAADYELEDIGNSAYVMEHFGTLPDRMLMLTFDDGPDPRFTPMILDILSREKVQATFFVLGEEVTSNPEILRRIIREGHMVGNHTATHIEFDEESDARNREEIIGTDRIIRTVGGYETRLFRIPRGDPDGNPLAVLQSQQLGYLHVNFDLDTNDWRIPPGQPVPVPELDGKGHIVLMHDGGGDRAATVKMLELLIANAKEQGYTFSTIAPLLPPEYRPRGGLDSSMADHVTLHAAQLIWVVPKRVMGWLFWFGVSTLTIMSSLYLVLAAMSYRRDRKRVWSVAAQRMRFVSVVIAAHNEEKVINRTLDALRASDYPPSKFEVIVVNDGSTDGTLAVLEAYAKEWSTLQIVNQRNGGKSVALNNGVRHANSKSNIIVTLDADTIFEPKTIRMLTRHFIQNTHSKQRPVGAVAGHVKVGNRRNLITAWQSLEYISGICVTRMAEGLIGAIAIVPGACSAWSRPALEHMGGFSHRTLAEDADATLQLHRLGYRVVQENWAVAYTEAPESIGTLARQRLRWMYGNIQVLWTHKGMILRPKHGALGMLALPYSVLSLLVPLVFLPPTVVVAVTSLIAGNWVSVVLFAAFVMALHLLISTVAITFARERAWHLLIVPVYRLIYEPLRAYLLYASLMRILRGKAFMWNKLERLNSVGVTTAS